MKLSIAFKAMQHGTKIKLPVWAGYWEWDTDKQTIMAHTYSYRDKKEKVEDIRKAYKLEHALTYIFSDKWEAATVDNCTLLGGEPAFDFTAALRCLKGNVMVKRKAWKNDESKKDLIIALRDSNHFIAVHTADINKDTSDYALEYEDVKANDWTFGVL